MSFVIRPSEVLRVVEGQSARYYSRGNVVFRVAPEYDRWAFEDIQIDERRVSPARPGLTFERYLAAVDKHLTEDLGIVVRTESDTPKES